MKRNTIKDLTIILLFIVTIFGTILYYRTVVSERDSKIKELDNEILNLKRQIENFTIAHIEVSLNVTDFPPNLSPYLPRPIPYNVLQITGLATNTGKGTAYNAGLHVDGYAANGTLIIDMTVPFMGWVGNDAETNNWLNISNTTKPSFGILYSGQSTSVTYDIYHKDTVTNWTITAGSTNSP